MSTGDPNSAPSGGKETRRAWPGAAQFNEAVQNLATTVSDRELQRGEPELSPLGVPMPYAGNFADVYKVHCPATGNTWAVKFFKREVQRLGERYQAISDCLAEAKLPFMTDFHYVAEGVRIAGAWYPLLKMRWIEGLALNRFVQQSLRQPKLLDQLFGLWVKVAARLQQAGVGHADLQHGNVLLVPGGEQGRLLLKLIDYDGMYVPALARIRSGENGHVAYQHPERLKRGFHGPQVDHFSHLAICCALRALQSRAELWDRFDNGDNLLFTERDFAEPSESALFHALWTIRESDVRSLAGHLALATATPPAQIPPLDNLVSGTQVRPLTADEESRIAAILFGMVAPPQRVEPARKPKLNAADAVAKLRAEAPLVAPREEPSAAAEPAPAKQSFYAWSNKEGFFSGGEAFQWLRKSLTQIGFDEDVGFGSLIAVVGGVLLVICILILLLAPAPSPPPIDMEELLKAGRPRR